MSASPVPRRWDLLQSRGSLHVRPLRRTATGNRNDGAHHAAGHDDIHHPARHDDARDQAGGAASEARRRGCPRDRESAMSLGFRRK